MDNFNNQLMLSFSSIIKNIQNCSSEALNCCLKSKKLEIGMTKEYKSSCKMSLESRNFSALEHSTKQKNCSLNCLNFYVFLTPNCTSLLSSPVIAFLSNATLVYSLV